MPSGKEFKKSKPVFAFEVVVSVVENSPKYTPEILPTISELKNRTFILLLGLKFHVVATLCDSMRITFKAVLLDNNGKLSRIITRISNFKLRFKTF